MLESSETAKKELGQSSASNIAENLMSSLLGQFSLKRLRGGLLFVIGYLLSPLCWWNDLIFNLPVAYGFGYLCSLVSANWLLPGLIVGYWLSNVLGFILMQFGALDALQKESKPRNPQKELFMGVVSSTIYTLIIVGLIQLKVIDTASLLPEELFNLGSLFPVRGL